MKNNTNAFKYLDFVLRILVLFHFLNIASWKYYTHDPEVVFKLPVFDIFAYVPTFLHISVFVLFTISSLLFVFRKKNYVYSFLLSFCFLYYELHDKFSFHQDIFLAVNIYFLYGLGRYHYLNKNYAAVKDYSFALKILCTLVYFFAGIHKLNPYFYSGNLIESILTPGILGKFTFLGDNFIATISQPLAIFTIIGELSIPILLWTKYKRAGVILGFLLHFGISFFGNRGILFNLYLPTLTILFFTYKSVDISQLTGKWKKWVKRLDVINLAKLNPKRKIQKSSLTNLVNNILFLNPIVIIYVGLYLYQCFVYLKKIILIQILGLESTSIMQLFQ
jgi:hypothetical protein